VGDVALDRFDEVRDTAEAGASDPLGRDLAEPAFDRVQPGRTRGHCLTKSRRFSTTFGALRAIRQEWTVTDKLSGAEPGKEIVISDDADGIVSEWSFVCMGYTTTGDVWLAESIAEEARLARWSAYQERQDSLWEPR
jgi:hypothetical protein